MLPRVVKRENRAAAAMRAYWDDRARANAAWYVDTSLDFSAPDMETFFATGRRIVDEAFEDGTPEPAGRELAVEIGSGLGRVCRALGERFERVIGIDLSREMTERARDLVQDNRIEFVLGDGRSLQPLGSATADLVISFTVFQHIPEPAVIESYILEAGRVLRTGGVFVFQWNNQPGARRWRVRRAILSALQRSGIRKEAHLRHDPSFLGSRVAIERIDAALRSARMERVRAKGLGTLYAWAWAVKR